MDRYEQIVKCSLGTIILCFRSFFDEFPSGAEQGRGVFLQIINGGYGLLVVVLVGK
jgi:hypothetical protein